jgi:TusA-related sulfurtransferase
MRDLSETAWHRLDLRGLKCPLPVLRTDKLLATLPSGSIVHVECTDPLAAIDIPHMLTQRGHVLESHETREGVLFFVIRT